MLRTSFLCPERCIQKNKNSIKRYCFCSWRTGRERLGTDGVAILQRKLWKIGKFLSAQKVSSFLRIRKFFSIKISLNENILNFSMK